MGNGASVLAYVQNLEQVFAIPILHVTEYPGAPIARLRDGLGSFHPPQGYVRLTQHPRLLEVCEKVALEAPIRHMSVRHR
ncbi:hypothetical protein SAMN05421505_109191 [Sinosporangium album]|uniref:Uncharacterized protein n=1 Tax=Sinosporangium album TaxID=504805 RepID=A0A1G7YBX5_9ACTN|nr:hypothetical protein [Sinosporangium album]SDG94028.1 hypothetical protein SAMN05421505_109191 [Sinosporangium album]